jgi:hypothetical protein
MGLGPSPPDPPCIEGVGLPDSPCSPLSCFNTTAQRVARNTIATTSADRITLTLNLTSMVPLPGTLTLLALGLAGLAFARRKQ